MMTLFSDPLCPYSHRVRMVLAEKTIAAEVIDVDAKALPERVREANPYETVPTLIERDLVLYESQIIMTFLDERYPHPPLMPVDPVTRARARLYMYRIDRDWYGLMARIKTGDDQAREELHDSLIGSAPLFAASRFFLSDELTLVDCVLAPLLWRLPSLGVVLPARGGAVMAYAGRIFDSAAFRQSLSEQEADLVAV
jgi:RNA polymerase-associated protein